MPGVGNQHAGLDPLGHREHVTKQQLLRDERNGGNPKCRDMDPRNRLRVFQLAECGPQHANAHSQQKHTQGERCSGLESLVPVGMLFIGLLLAVMPREQNDEIGNQI